MECSHPKVSGCFTDHLLKTRAKFARRLIGEGYRKDAVRNDILLFEKVSYPVSEHSRLAATSAPAKIRHGPSV